MWLPKRVLACCALVVAWGHPFEALADQLGQLERDVIQRRQLTEWWVSPDGTKLLYCANQGAIETNAIASNCWTKTLGDGSEERQDISGRTFGWGPDSATFLYITDKQELRSRNLVSHQDKELLRKADVDALFADASSTAIRDVRISPAGKLAALSVQVSKKADPHPLRGVTVDASWNIDAVGPLTAGVLASVEYTTLVIVNLETRKLSRALPDTVDLGSDLRPGVDWSPDSRSIAFSSKPRAAPAPDIMQSDLFILDIASNTVRTLVAQPGFDLDPRWSPDGSKIAFKTLDGVEDWTYVSQVGIVDVARSQARYYAPTRRSPEDPRVRYVQLEEWSANSRDFFYIAPAQGQHLLMSLDTISGETRAVSAESLDIGYAVGPHQSSFNGLVVPASTFNSFADLYLWKPGSDRQERITDLNPQFAGKTWAHVESVHWPSSDGKWNLQGFLITSPDRKVEKPPLIVFVNGGPSMVSAWGIEYTYNFYPWSALLERGYALFMPNTRGRGGFGTAFRHALRDSRSINRIAAEDVMSGVKFLVREGRIDPARIAIAGHSYGGAPAVSALERNTQFRAASIHEAVNLFVAPTESYTAETWRHHLMRDYGAPSPFDRAQRSQLRAESPGDNADLIQTPILLEFGLLSIARSQGRPFFAALQHFDAPSEFVVYPRTGHVTQEPALIADAYQRNLDWFEFWLRGREDPDPSKRQQYDRWEGLCDRQVARVGKGKTFCVESR